MQGGKDAATLLALLKVHDPLFKTTWRMLKHMLAILPDTAEYLVKKGTHDDPARFLALYEEMREWAQEVEHRRRRRKGAQRSTHSGPALKVAEAGKARHRDELSALVARVKSGRAEEGDMLRYIELSMAGGSRDSDSEGGR